MLRLLAKSYAIFLVTVVVISQNSLKNRYIPSKPTSTNLKAVQSSGLWNAGLKFGNGPFRYYDGFDKWMEPFPQEDCDAMPEYFQIPEGEMKSLCPSCAE